MSYHWLLVLCISDESESFRLMYGEFDTEANYRIVFVAVTTIMLFDDSQRVFWEYFCPRQDISVYAIGLGS